jgi:Fic family protein
MSFNPLTPYNNLPLLPPLAELESKEILRKAISANRALAELKGAGELIPNQSMLINSIPLQEARVSSEIENIITTNDKLFEAAAVESVSDPETKEVLHYRTALINGFNMLQVRPLSVNLMIDICRTLKNTEVDVRKAPGTTLSNPATGEVYYTPPEEEGIIREKLDNLETYIHQEDYLDPLIKMAVVHYQFEAIHPFHDGNGRTGRILNILFLVEKGLLKIPVLHLSRYFIQNKNEYYRLLREVTTNGGWATWVIYMLNAVEETAFWTCEIIKAIRDLLEETIIFCRELLPGSVYSRELINLIFVQPYCKIAFLVEAGIAERKTASVYLQKLEGIGVLRSSQLGREKVYINPRLIDLLTS